MTTVLALIQSTCYEVGIPAPTTIYASTDPVDLQLKNLFYTEARFLRRQRIFNQQKKYYSFATTASRTKYPLPRDFYALSGNTIFDQTNKLYIYGPVNDSLWQDRKYRSIHTGSPYGFRIWGPDFNTQAGVGGQLELLEVPTGAVTISLEYTTCNLFSPANWTASETGITTSKYRTANGNNYDCTAITTGTCGTTAPAQTSGTFVDGGVTWTYYGTPYETFLADDDQCLFDDDIMIHGLKWRYKQSKDQDYQGDQLAHKALVDQTRSRFHGSYVGGGARNMRYGPRYWVPDRGWSL